MGGMGVYSHGSMNLTHQHWVQQVISAGGFNVHCTQRAEAAHKLCMHRAVERVRKLHKNHTQSSMSQYLRNYFLFEELKKQFPVFKKPDVPRTFRSGTRVPLLSRSGYPVTMRMDGVQFTAARFQSTFIHPEVRIARVELLNLVCKWIGIPQTRKSYEYLQRVEFCFGQKLIREDGEIYWATDSQYSFAMADKSHRRRDILRITGSEVKKYKLSTKQHIKLNNALCGEAIMFFTVYNLSALRDMPLSRGTTKAVRERLDSLVTCGYVSLILLRWFQPGNTLQRDAEHRPVCPGPLHINHCLWQYACTERARKIMTNDTFKTQSFVFGRNADEQRERFQQEKNAYFGLVTPDSIMHTVNMCPTFYPNSATLNHSVWLQSVTLL